MTTQATPTATRPLRPLVVALGVFPPPVTGMSLCTERVAEALSARCDVRRFNLSDGSLRITWAFRGKKLLRLIAALGRLAVQPSLKGAVLYMPLNATGAMYYNIAAAAIARLRGWRTIVHHHVYLYLNQRDWRVRLLDRLMGARGLHLPLCPDMRRRLVELYNIVAPCAIVPSTIMLAGRGSRVMSVSTQSAPRAVRRLGHISNLTQAKGALIAIQTFAGLRQAGHDVELIMAGPATEEVVARQISAAQEQFGASFDYRGPVYGEAKQKFFEDIDLLLFPSSYHNEAQPIVLSEAFAFGKPALAFGISCIPSLVATPEWHICPQGDFASLAGELFTRWQIHPGEYAAARDFAYQRAQDLKIEAEHALEMLTSWVGGEDVGDFVLRRSATAPTPQTAASSSPRL